MKTAISIPDEVFRLANRLAKSLGISRSQVFSDAVKDYANRKNSAEVTKRLNEIYGPDGKGSELDPAWRAAAIRTIERATEGDTW